MVPESSPTMMPVSSSILEDGAIPLIVVTEIQSKDVLLGKQKNCHRHPGTVAFRVLVAVKTEEYAIARRSRSYTRSPIIEEVSNQISSGGGRFLKRQDWSSRDSTEGKEKWCVLSKKEIHEKVALSFRDRIKSLKKVTNRKRERSVLFQKLTDYFLAQKNKQGIITYEDILQKMLHSEQGELLRESSAVTSKKEMLPIREHVVAGGAQHWCSKAGNDPALTNDQHKDWEANVVVSSSRMESCHEKDDSKDRSCVSFSRSDDGYLVITPPTGAVWKEYRLKMQMDDSDMSEWIDDLDDLIASPDN